MLGHVDVVPAGTGWDSDPFEPIIKDEKFMLVVQVTIKGQPWLHIMR